MTERLRSSVRLVGKCDALVDCADGWIETCGGEVVWEAPEGDPLGPLAYCRTHYVERVS